jgi:hypothetical protein
MGRTKSVVRRVPEPKTAQNRQHFDLRPTADRAAERDRLIALGAIVVHEYDETLRATSSASNRDPAPAKRSACGTDVSRPRGNLRREAVGSTSPDRDVRISPIAAAGVAALNGATASDHVRE